MGKTIDYFSFAGYLWIFTGLSHFAFQIITKQPVNETERLLFPLMTDYQKSVAGGLMTMKDIVDGLSLCYSLFLISTGVIGLYFIRIRAEQKVLRATAYIQIACSSLGVLIALRYFFWLPVVAFAFITLLLGIYLKKIHAIVKH